MCSNHPESLTLKKMNDAGQDGVVAADGPAEQRRKIDQGAKVDAQILQPGAAHRANYNKVRTVFLA